MQNVRGDSSDAQQGGTTTGSLPAAEIPSAVSAQLDDLQAKLKQQRESGDRRGEAVTLNNIAGMYQEIGQPQKALDYYNQALPIRREVGDRRGEAVTLNNIGSVYSGLGQPQKALDYYNQALPIRREVGDRRGEATTVTNIGSVYSHLGQPQKALDYYNQALPILREVGDRRGEAVTLNNIAGVYSDLGQAQKALDSYNQALPIRREVGDRRGEATTLNSIGLVYFALGQAQKALDYLNQALPILREVGDRRGEATALSDIGGVYSGLGQPQKALDYLNQALPILREVGDRGGEAATLNGIGEVYSALGQPQKALDYLNQALPIRWEVGDRGGEAATLNSIGEAYSALGQPQKALDYYNQALPLAVAVEDPLLEANILGNLMDRFRSEDPYLAVFFGKQTINLLQQVRGNIQALDKELQKSFVGSNEDYYRQLADVLIDQGRLSEAQEVIDLMRAEQFNQFTRARDKSATRPVSLSPVEQKMDQEYEQETRNLLATYEEFSTLNKKSDRSAEEEKRLAELKSQVEHGFEHYRALLTNLDQALRGAEKEKLDRARNEVPGLANLVSNLDPGTVALYTLVVNDRYRVIVILGGKAPPVERSYTIKATELRHLVSQFVTLLGGKNPSRRDAERQDLLDVSQKLYAIVIGPVANDLRQAQAHTLVWELDDVLRYIPMGALYDGANKQFLVEQYASVIITPTDTSGGGLKDVPELKSTQLLAMGLSRP